MRIHCVCYFIYLPVDSNLHCHYLWHQQVNTRKQLTQGVTAMLALLIFAICMTRDAKSPKVTTRYTLQA